MAPLMANFKTAMQRITNSDISLINDINRHLFSRQGKQLRPAMTMLTACCCGLSPNIDSSHTLFNAAAAVETLHTSTLIHDDVVDESNIRRGIATVNNNWGNKAAVLVGDFYLSRVMKVLNDIFDHDITDTVNHAVEQMSVGELLQIQYCGKQDINEEVYYNIIGKKTASFMAACCKLGAIIAGAEKEVQEEAYSFGYNTGMAFQIRDDMIDFLPTEQTGKCRFNDIHEHKTTLPMIFMLQSLDKNNKKEIITLLEKEVIPDEDVERIASLATNKEIMAKTRQALGIFIDKAQKSLLSLPANQYRNALKEIMNSILE